jgi:hypothetical protein
VELTSDKLEGLGLAVVRHDCNCVSRVLMERVWDLVEVQLGEE